MFHDHDKRITGGLATTLASAVKTSQLASNGQEQGRTRRPFVYSEVMSNKVRLRLAEQSGAL